MNPARLALSNGTLVVSQSLARGEESPALVAQELADLPMLRDLVTQAVVLPRETLGATKSAGERGPRFGLVGLCVNLQRVLTGEAP